MNEKFLKKVRSGNFLDAVSATLWRLWECRITDYRRFATWYWLQPKISMDSPLQLIGRIGLQAVKSGCQMIFKGINNPNNSKNLHFCGLRLPMAIQFPDRSVSSKSDRPVTKTSQLSELSQMSNGHSTFKAKASLRHNFNDNEKLNFNNSTYANWVAWWVK